MILKIDVYFWRFCGGISYQRTELLLVKAKLDNEKQLVRL